MIEIKKDSPSGSLSATASAATAASSATLCSVISGTELTAESSSAPASWSSVVGSALLEPLGDLLLRFNEKLEEISDDVGVLVVEEGSGKTNVSYSTSSTDSVDVLVNVRGKIEVDDVSDVGDIKTSSGDLLKKKVSFLFV